MRNTISNLLTPKGRWLPTLLLLFTLGIGQMWGADPTHESPSIVEKANRTFLNLAGTPSNVTVSTDSYSNYGPGYFISNKSADLSASWWSFSGTFKSSSSSYSNHKDAVGFHAVGSSSSSEFYQILQLRTGNGRMTQMDFYVTGTTQMGFQWKNGGTNGSKYLSFAIYEMNVTGATATDGASPVATIEGSKTSSNDPQYGAATSLDASKYYHVVLTAYGESNCNFYGLTFKHAPAASHTVTYLPGAGSGPDYIIDDDATTVSGCPAQFSYTGHDFAGWKDALNNDVAVGATVTSDMTLTAQWVEHVAKYTVKYMDGTTELGSEEVNVGSTPAGLASDPTKDCYTFAAWSPALSSVSGEENDEVEVNATWTPIYSSSATLISDANVSAKANVNTIFAASNIVSSITFTSGNYEFTSNVTKPGYYGYKDKASGDYMKIMLKQGKRAQVLFGNLGADPTITVNGVAKSLDAARTTGDMAENTFTWTASAEDALISITMGSGTNTLKKVDVIQLYTATRVDGKSDGAGTDANVLQTTLPTPAAVSGWTFTGWTANEDVKDSEENTITAGTVLAAGTYTLLANTTFTAQWAEATATYDVTYVSVHGTAPDAENAASVVLAELNAEGWAHKGWTANADVTVDAATVEAGTLIANGKTAILESNVTFTAVWKEIFTVTFDSKGGSSVSPIDVEDGASIAAAPANPTKDDYIFQGWSETDGGDVVADITALTITDDKTLYAKWKLDVQVSEIVFSNSFKGWIVGSTVTVFYMAGESAPTIASYAGKNLKAEGGVVISGDKIIATATDDSELEFDLTMTEVTPLTATGAQTFDGSEGYVKTRHAWTADRKWKMSKYGTDGRVARGETSLYIFLGAAESVTLDWGAQKVTEDVAVYVNGTFVKNIGKNNNSAIALSNGNNMVALYSLQTSGDIWLNGLTVAPWVPVTAVALKEGEDPIASKEIYAGANFTLTAEVTPDNASDKTITWTSSNNDVATVVNGVVTGVAANATPVTITASTVDGVNATCSVTVTAAPEPSADPVITAQPSSANYYEGATIAALEVVATGESLTYQWYLGSDAIDGATAATYQPTVSAIGSYVYHCVVTNTEVGNLPTSLASDNATITIADDPAAIKLFGNTGVLNTTDFISPEATTIEISDVEYPCLVQFSSNRTSLAGATPSDMVMYNVTTDKAMIKMTFYNNNSGVKKAILYKYEEGAEAPEKIEIEVPGQTVYTTDYYTFNSSKNRSFYVCMNDRSNIRVLQVKVIDNGANPVKQFGQVGYSLNLNKGRLYAKDGVEKTFEGWTLTTSSEYKVYNNSNLATKAANSFTIASPAIMHVERSGGKYYVYQDPEDKGTLYAANADIELNATGTWYLSSETTSSATSFTLISFAAPKCEKPAFNALQNSELCAADPYIALDGTGTVTDGGSITYKWYAERGTDVLGTNATYTPTADGSYYVVALHHVDGFTDNEATSDVVSVTHYASAAITTAPENQRVDAGDNATLSVVATGKAPLAYQWYTCDDELGTNPVIIAGAESDSYVVAVTDGFSQYYKVVVTSGCGEASAVAKVEAWVELPQLDVTEAMTWDWTYAGENNKLVAGKNVEVVMANIKENGKQPTNDATFRSQALLFYGENVRATDGGRNYASVGHIKFNVTVPGKVTVEFSDNGDNNRRLKINDQMSESSSSKTDVKTFAAYVEAGEVTLMGVEEDGTGSNKYIRISKIEFTTADESRANLQLGGIGTVCLPFDVATTDRFGGTFYKADYKGPGFAYFIEEIGTLKAGQAYIFVAEEEAIRLWYSGSEVLTPLGGDEARGFYGTFDYMPAGSLEGKYVIANGKLRLCGAGATLSANRAYIVLDDMPNIPLEVNDPANAPVRRRLGIGGNNGSTTDLQNYFEFNAEGTQKVIMNGQLYILRDGKMYNAQGQLMK